MVWRLLSFCECLYVSFRVLVTPKPQQRTTPLKSVQVFLLLLLVLPFLGGYRFLLSVFFLQSPAHPFFQRHHFHSGGKPRCTKVSELLRLVVEVEDLTVLKCVQIPFFLGRCHFFFAGVMLGYLGWEWWTISFPSIFRRLFCLEIFLQYLGMISFVYWGERLYIECISHPGCQWPNEGL